MKMSELSRRLMVTGGNVTGLTDELAREGMVERESSPADRRAWIVRLTPKGRRRFETMASEHERWILELFAGLDATRRAAAARAARQAACPARHNEHAAEANPHERSDPDASTRRSSPATASLRRLPRPRHFAWSVDGGVGHASR